MAASRHTALVKAVLDYIETVKALKGITGVKTGVIKTKTAEDRFISTGKKGWPDITCCCRRYQGRLIGIEVKIPPDKQSKAQKEAQEEIERAGGLYFIVTSLEEAIAILG